MWGLALESLNYTFCSVLCVVFDRFLSFYRPLNEPMSGPVDRPMDGPMMVVLTLQSLADDCASVKMLTHLVKSASLRLYSNALEIRSTS